MTKLPDSLEKRLTIYKLFQEPLNDLIINWKYFFKRYPHLLESIEKENTKDWEIKLILILGRLRIELLPDVEEEEKDDYDWPR